MRVDSIKPPLCAAADNERILEGDVAVGLLISRMRSSMFANPSDFTNSSSKRRNGSCARSCDGVLLATL